MAAYEHKLAETRKRFHRGMDVYEFGCGTGTTALHHAPYVRLIEAVGISSNMIAIAEEKRLEAGVIVLPKESLIAGMTEAGFEIDYVWQSKPKQAAFLIARKPNSAG